MTRTRAKELLPIIQAYADGGTIEWRDSAGRWRSMNSPSFDDATGSYRIAPKPVTRAWSKPEDVPASCWLRDFKEPSLQVLVVAVHEQGVQCFDFNTERLETTSWIELRDKEHSTDRVTWHPCTVTEEAR